MKHTFFLRTPAVMLSVLLMAASFSPLGAGAETIPPGAIAAVTTDSATTFYYDTAVSGGMNAMWNDAVASSKATVKLYADWNAAQGTRLVNGGKGAAGDGAICVPSGHEITLDLNGFSINRMLETAVEDGEVILIENGGTLNLTDTKASSGGAGKITGGFSTNTAGGIVIADGGTLNLWGGCITGNQTEDNGGGICLDGEGATLYMTGGSIEQNTAGMHGGGIALFDGSVEIVTGDITGNTAAGEGGGVLMNGGSMILQAGTIASNTAECGGGITTTGAASLCVQDSYTIQENLAMNRGAEEGGEGGGGIHAKSSLPVKLSGTPQISSNRLSNGMSSNLTFWVDDTHNQFVGPRVVDEGVLSGASVGIGFSGADYLTNRELGVAPSWGTDIFFADTKFELLQADGVMYLRRAAVLSDYYLLLGIGGVVVLLVVTVMVIVMVRYSKKHKKQKHRKHKKHPAKQVKA